MLGQPGGSGDTAGAAQLLVGRARPGRGELGGPRGGQVRPDARDVLVEDGLVAAVLVELELLVERQGQAARRVGRGRLVLVVQLGLRAAARLAQVAGNSRDTRGLGG